MCTDETCDTWHIDHPNKNSRRVSESITDHSPATFIRLELEPQHPLQITRRPNRVYRAEAVPVCDRISKISNYGAARSGEVGGCVDAVKLGVVESIKSIEPGFEPIMLAENKTLR